MVRIRLVVFLVFLSFILSSCGNEDKESPNGIDKRDVEEVSTFNQNPFFEPFKGKLEHVHGLGYAGNQDAVFFASHDGIKVYQNGEWFKAKEFNNDYMGFNAVEKGFYTSGHPGKGVDLPNPLGLSRSYDNGETLEFLGFQNESDFHVMGVGYNNHHIYLLNEYKSTQLDVGLFFSDDDGKTWEELEASNLGKDLVSIAVHPSKNGILAAASKEGIFLSEDKGASFTLLTSKSQGTSVFFSEESLWFGAYDGQAKLVEYSILESTSTDKKLPEMPGDAVMYFAQNPKNIKEAVFITFQGNMFRTNDGGDSWLTIDNK